MERRGPRPSASTQDATLPGLPSKERTRTWGTRRLFPPAAQVREILQGSRLPGNIVIASDCEECGGRNCKGASESSAGILPAVASASRARRRARRSPDSRRDGGATNYTVTLPFPAKPRPAALLPPSRSANSGTPHPESPDSASLPRREPGMRPPPARPL